MKLVFKNYGQTLMEFTLVISFVIIVLFAMQPMIKRSIQAMVKVTADQVGSQQNAEQLSYSSADDGFFLGSNAMTSASTDTGTRDVNGEIIYTYNDEWTVNSISEMYLGDSEK